MSSQNIPYTDTCVYCICSLQIWHSLYHCFLPIPGFTVYVLLGIGEAWGTANSSVNNRGGYIKELGCQINAVSKFSSKYFNYKYSEEFMYLQVFAHWVRFVNFHPLISHFSGLGWIYLHRGSWWKILIRIGRNFASLRPVAGNIFLRWINALTMKMLIF